MHNLGSLLYTQRGVRHKQVCARVNSKGLKKLSLALPHQGVEPKVFRLEFWCSNHGVTSPGMYPTTSLYYIIYIKGHSLIYSLVSWVNGSRNYPSLYHWSFSFFLFAKSSDIKKVNIDKALSMICLFLSLANDSSETIEVIIIIPTVESSSSKYSNLAGDCLWHEIASHVNYIDLDLHSSSHRSKF